jgi:hypothetical protein
MKQTYLDSMGDKNLVVKSRGPGSLADLAETPRTGKPGTLIRAERKNNRAEQGDYQGAGGPLFVRALSLCSLNLRGFLTRLIVYCLPPLSYLAQGGFALQLNRHRASRLLEEQPKLPGVTSNAG